MKFEVDNTTKQLLEELQGGIKNTFSSMENEQIDIKILVEEIKRELEECVSKDEIKDLKRNIEGGNKKTNQQIVQFFENLQELKSMVKTELESESDEKLMNSINKSIDEVYKRIRHDINEIHKSLGSYAKKREIEELVLSVKSEVSKINNMFLENDVEAFAQKLNKMSEKLDECVSKGEINDLKKHIEGDNIKTNQQIEQYFENLQELKNMVETELETQSDEIHKLLDSYAKKHEIEEMILSVKSEINNMFLENYVEVLDQKLNKMSEKLDKYDGLLNQLQDNINDTTDKFALEINRLETLEKRNNVILESIAGYLSLSGRKRIFKGMEIDDYEEIN